MTAISDTWALTVRDLLRVWRQPWFMEIVLVQPVIWLLLFGDLFERGVTDRLLVTPARRWPLIAGRLGQERRPGACPVGGHRRHGACARCRARKRRAGVAALVLAAVLLGTAFAALSNALALVARQEATVADYNPVDWAIVAGREAVGSGTDWGTVAGYCALLAGFALACTMLATRAFRAYQAQV